MRLDKRKGTGVSVSVAAVGLWVDADHVGHIRALDIAAVK